MASGRRQFCKACDRPQKVCLCEALPEGALRKSPLRVILLQHPLERKQKHQTDQFLLRTLSDVFLVVGRKLESAVAEKGQDPNDTSAEAGIGCAGAADGSDLDTTKKSSTQFVRLRTKQDSIGLWKMKKAGQKSSESAETSEVPGGQDSEGTLDVDLRKTVCLFPSETAVDAWKLLESTPNAVKDATATDESHVQATSIGRPDTLIVLDATWQYAKEMWRSSELLSRLPCVTLHPTVNLPEPEFVVRKPERISCPESLQTDASKSTESILGHSTAEAVALFLDQYCQARDEKAQKSRRAGEGSAEGLKNREVVSNRVAPIYEDVLRPLRLYVKYQLDFTGENIKHRKSNPAYEEGLYEAKRKKIAESA